MLYSYNYFSIIIILFYYLWGYSYNIIVFSICYEELLLYFILTNYDVMHTIMISMHDVRFTHS